MRRQATRLILFTIVGILAVAVFLSVRSYFARDSITISRHTTGSGDSRVTRTRSFEASLASGGMEVLSVDETVYSEDDQPTSVPNRWMFERFTSPITHAGVEPDYSTERRRTTRHFGPMVMWLDGWQSSDSTASVRGWRFLIWPAIFILALVVLAFMAPTVRRLRRHRRGLCPRCGYDLRGSFGRCPECGTFAERGGPAAA
jgi:hypothetical protein